MRTMHTCAYVSDPLSPNPEPPPPPTTPTTTPSHTHILSHTHPPQPQRLRKKFFFESLQKQVSELQRENSVLKDIIKVNRLWEAPQTHRLSD